MIDGVTVLIPFFGGTSSATNSDARNRERYLRKTIESVRVFGPDVLVGVCTKADERVYQNVIRLRTEPEHLASALCRWGQEHLLTTHVYVTEADQVVHFSREIFDFADDESYLVPHRLEQVHEHETGTLIGSDRGSCVRYKDRIWVIPNGQPTVWAEHDVYEPMDKTDGFGGGFLATERLFRRVDFSNSKVYPVEHATGFRIYDTGRCLKTGMWSGFFVEHLSGIEYHKRLVMDEGVVIRQRGVRI